MSKIAIVELLDRIHEIIPSKLGKGFTLEANAEVTKYVVYKWKAPSLIASIIDDDAKDTLIVSKIRKDVKYLSSFNRDAHRTYNLHLSSNNVDLDFSISQDIENKLPRGITISKTLPVVLHDTRDFYESVGTAPCHKDTLKDFQLKYMHPIKHPEYIEGRRVYLTVTDEYASRIFEEKCCRELAFRDILLTKYENILKEIANYFLSYCHIPRLTFTVGYSGIGVWWNSGDYTYGGRGFSFKDWEMRNLNSYVELYGMAFALIETVKTIDPNWNHADFILYEREATINIDNREHILIHYKLPPQTIVEESKKLKEW